MTKLLDSSSITQPSVDSLLSIMGNGPMTSGWDIVCSYSLNQLNNQLLMAYEAENSKIVKNVTLSVVQEDPFTGETYTIEYNLILGAPSLQFITDNNGECLLTMPLNGSYTFTPQGGTETTCPIDSNTYSVVVQVKLVAIVGNEQQSAGNIISFTSEGQQSQITLHFETIDGNDKASWSIQPPPADIAIQAILVTLSNYFQANVQAIDYTLAGISNQNNSNQDIIITPESFVFATYSGKDSSNNDIGMLSIYIQTTNSNNPAGDTTPTFQPVSNSGVGTSTLPIPQNYETTLIFSRSFLQKVYLIPQFQANSFIDVTSYVDPISEGNTGCKVSGSYNNVIEVDKSSDNSSGNLIIYYDPFTIDLRTGSTFSFVFSNDSLNISMATSTSDSWEVYEPGHNSFGPAYTGTAKASISLAKQMELSSISTVSDQDININLSLVETDYSVTIDPGTSDSWWNDDLGSSVKEGIQEKLTDIIPSIKINFEGINFFQMTNLLFPSEQIIHLDSSQSIHVPCDLILFGQFVTQS